MMVPGLSHRQQSPSPFCSIILVPIKVCEKINLLLQRALPPLAMNRHLLTNKVIEPLPLILNELKLRGFRDLLNQVISFPWLGLLKIPRLTRS